MKTPAIGQYVKRCNGLWSWRVIDVVWSNTGCYVYCIDAFKSGTRRTFRLNEIEW